AEQVGQRDRARSAGGLELRVRISDGADESSPRAVARNGVHDAGGAVHLSQLEVDQGSLRSRRRGAGVGAAAGGGPDEGENEGENSCSLNVLPESQHLPP